MVKSVKRRKAGKQEPAAIEAVATEAIVPRALVPAKEVMDKLAKRRRAYWDLLDEVVKAALGLTEPGCDGQGYEEARIDDPSGEPVKRNIRAHAFDLMAAKGQITPHEWAAGTRFRDDVEFARISPLRARSMSDLYDLRSGPAFSRPTPPSAQIAEGGSAEPKTGLSADDKKSWLDSEVRRAAQTWKPRAVTLNITWNDLRPSVIDAQDRLKAVHRVVGAEGYRLLEAICAEGRTIASLEQGGSASSSVSGRAADNHFGNRRTIAKKLRAALDALGQHYGMWSGSSVQGRADQSDRHRKRNAYSGAER